LIECFRDFLSPYWLRPVFFHYFSISLSTLLFVVVQSQLVILLFSSSVSDIELRYDEVGAGKRCHGCSQISTSRTFHILGRQVDTPEASPKKTSKSTQNNKFAKMAAAPGGGEGPASFFSTHKRAIVIAAVTAVAAGASLYYLSSSSGGGSSTSAAAKKKKKKAQRKKKQEETSSLSELEDDGALYAVSETKRNSGVQNPIHPLSLSKRRRSALSCRRRMEEWSYRSRAGPRGALCPMLPTECISLEKGGG
jgi:hypothetical protein